MEEKKKENFDNYIEETEEDFEEYTKDTAKIPKGALGGIFKGSLKFILFFLMVIALVVFVYFKVMVKY